MEWVEGTDAYTDMMTTESGQMVTIDPDLPQPGQKYFHWADYLIFAAFLLANIGVGLYQGLKPLCTKEEESAQTYLVANRNMSVFPVSLSILSAFLSAILILGTPAEIYTEGTMYWMYVWGMMLSCVFATLLFVPLLYPLKLTSSYEYLEMRFGHKAPKLVGTIILIVMQLLYMGVCLFSPATALEAVTGFPVWASILIGGVVSIIYSALGGMKGSVWASVVQSAIMAAGVIAVIIRGCVDMGGFGNVWYRSYDMGRMQFFDFNPSPLKRHSFWTLIVGGTVGWLSTYGVNQASVQRYSSVPTLKAARTTVLLNIPGLFIFVTLCTMSGLVVFAWYDFKGCDPLAANYISNPNQLLPFYVMDRLGYPCVPGLFLACLFAGALSTMSSSLGALAAVVWEDMIKPCAGHLGNRSQTLIIKMLVVFFGGVGIGMAFMAEKLGGTVLQASISFTGAAGGPLLGLFILGGMFPCANWIGAVVGGIVGLAFPLWVSIGAYTNGVTRPKLNTTVAMCLNYTAPNATMTPPKYAEDVEGLETLYLVSYLWYPAIGAATCVLIGLVVSWLTGCYDPSEVDPKLNLPFFDRVFCCCPNKSLYIMRCKIELYNPDEDEEEVITSGKEAMPYPDGDMQEKQGHYNQGYHVDPPDYDMEDLQPNNGKPYLRPQFNGMYDPLDSTPALHSMQPGEGATRL